jgi:hypothetical protein
MNDWRIFIAGLGARHLGLINYRDGPEPELMPESDFLIELVEEKAGE